MGGLLRFGALVLGLAAAGPAVAGDKQDFVACDGRSHPGEKSDGMRGEPSRPSFMLGLGGVGTSAAGKVAACDRALASARLLPGQKLRRAHLLRARAAAHLQAGNAEKAVADLDLAEAEVAGSARDRFHKRSMGVSLDLLRAIVRAQQGDGKRAAALAQAAMALRPYSSQVQQLGAEIVHFASESGDGSAKADWSMAMRLDPSAAATVLMRESQAGNFKEVLALRPSVALNWPEKAPPAFMLMQGGGDGANLLQAVLVSYQTAYAHAATGGTAQAKAELATVRSKIQALRPVAAAGAASAPAPAAAGTPDVATLLEKGLEAKTKQIEARIAVAEGRHGDAIAALVGVSMPKDAATIELLRALKSQAPAKDAALVPEADAFAAEAAAQRRETLARLASLALITPETPRAVVDYEKSRPNILGALVGGALSMGTSLLGGIDRLDGFRSTKNEDGTTKVAFVGNTPSAMLVQEMTLLRAAEVTRAAGKPAFVIVERKDYARSLRTTRAGMEISNVPTGFKTEMNIRFLDSADQSPRALDAVAVIDALGPLYYEEKGAKP